MGGIGLFSKRRWVHAASLAALAVAVGHASAPDVARADYIPADRHIWAVDRLTGEYHRFTNGPGSWGTGILRWSPGGRRLATVEGIDLGRGAFAVRAALLSPTGRVTKRFWRAQEYIDDVRWSADGRRLLVTVGRPADTD